jgi:hypothetical protein
MRVDSELSTGWLLAAENVDFVQSLGKRTGRRRHPPGRRVPAGTAHAINASATTAACGREATTLTVLNLTWRQGSFLDRCQECMSAVPPQ